MWKSLSATKPGLPAAGEMVMVEDVGAYFLRNGLPGALIKWFVKTVNIDGILKMYPDTLIAGQKRSAMWHRLMEKLPHRIRKSIGDDCDRNPREKTALSSINPY